MTTNINLENLQMDAAEIFNSGFACSESVIYAIRKHFEIDLSDDAIAMSSVGTGRRRMPLRRTGRCSHVHRLFLWPQNTG